MTPHTASTPSPRSFPVSFSRSCSGVWGGLLPGNHPGDFPHGGVHAGSCHHPGSRPGSDGGKGEDSVLPLPQGGLLPAQGLGVLLHRQGLPCQGGLLRLQVHGFEKPQVRRHQVPRLEDHQVPGDQLGAVHHLALALPHHRGVGGGELAQGGDGFVRPPLLEGADAGVGGYDGQDDQAVQVLPLTPQPGDQVGHPRRPQQNQDHKVLKLPEKPPGKPRPPVLPELVLPPLGLALGGLGPAQAPGAVCLQQPHRLLAAHMMQFHTFSSPGSSSFHYIPPIPRV